MIIKANSKFVNKGSKVTYQVGISDPNQIRSQDFVEGKKSNFFVLRGPELKFIRNVKASKF